MIGKRIRDSRTGLVTGGAKQSPISIRQHHSNEIIALIDYQRLTRPCLAISVLETKCTFILFPNNGCSCKSRGEPTAANGLELMNLRRIAVRLFRVRSLRGSMHF